MRDESRVNLPRGQIGEEALAFIPVKNTGVRAFTLALDAQGAVLWLCTENKKYKIELEELNDGI